MNFTCGSLSLRIMLGLKNLAHLYPCFTRVFSHVKRCGRLAFFFFFCGDPKLWLRGSLKNASFGPPPNLHTCISLVEVYQFGECLGWIFSPILIFISPVSSRAFRDAPHSRFWCGYPNKYLPNFLKVLLLALLQIYTRVFHLWKSMNLDSAWVRDSRLYQLFFLS